MILQPGDIGPWESHVFRSPQYFDLSVMLWRRRGDGGADIVAPTTLVVERVPADGRSVERDPSFRIEEGVARALLESIAAYFGGTSDLQRLREDLSAERRRSDKMLDALIGLVQRPTT